MQIAITAVKRVISKKSGKDVPWNIVSAIKPDGEALKPIFMTDEDVAKYGITPNTVLGAQISSAYKALPRASVEFNDQGRLDSFSLEK